MTPTRARPAVGDGRARNTSTCRSTAVAGLIPVGTSSGRRQPARRQKSGAPSCASATCGPNPRTPEWRPTDPQRCPDRFDGPPKTDAGYRTVAIPPHVIPLVREHLDCYAGTERVFVGRSGEPMRGDAIRLAFDRARREVGLEHLRFHDLRHTGQTLAAEAGASLADLMRRLGHSSMVAAKRYLHATDSRDRQIADALSKLAATSGTDRPRTIMQR